MHNTTTLFVSPSNVPMIKYEDERIRLADLLKWRDVLSELGIDLMKIIVFADIKLFSAFQRSLLDAGIAMMKKDESIIPYSNNQIDFGINEKIEFTGLKVYENEKVVMRVYVYETYN